MAVIDDGPGPHTEWFPLKYNLYGDQVTGALARGKDRVVDESLWPDTVRWIRGLLDVSSAELARLVGTDDRNVRRWIAGDTLPSQAARRMLVRIAVTAVGEDLPHRVAGDFVLTVIGTNADVGNWEPHKPPSGCVLVMQRGEERRGTLQSKVLGQASLDRMTLKEIEAAWAGAIPI